MGAGEDRISGLPDELLHGIFLRLGSVGDAVRAGVVSRRWRHVLGRPLPELVFEQGLHDHEPPPRPPCLEPFLDSVDAALAACDAPVVKRLRIYWMWCGPLSMAAASRLPAGRVEPWLRFASERVVDFLDLHVYPPGLRGVNGEGGVIDLPLCEWVKRISVGFRTGGWRIRPPSAGLFQALTELRIRDGCMDGSELTALVCTQCPGLKMLHLCLRLVDASDISIRSDSLQSLWFGVQETRRLEIVAPGLEKLFVILAIDEVQITAPKLEELVWPKFDPSCHRFDDVGRRLRMLQPGRKSGSLMQQFDEVDELRLTISIPQELDGYKSFLDETNWLPKCKLLRIYSDWDLHAFVPGILHLLRSCNSTSKISLAVSSSYALEPCLPYCPCLFEESYRIDDISLNSLEEVEITFHTSSHEVLEFVELLSRCNASKLKKIVIVHKFASPPAKEERENIRTMCQPNIEVEFYVCLNWELVPLD